MAGDTSRGPGTPPPAPPAGGAWAWLPPSFGYAMLVGLLGITTKLALDDLRWTDLILWAAVAYAAIAVVLSVGGVRPRLGRGAGFAALSGVFAALGLLLLFVALEHGDAGQVVPVTAAYPVVTAGVAALVLSERITPLRVAGTLLVVAGVAVLGME